MSKFTSRIAALFPRSAFARNVLLMSSATGLGQALVIVAAPLLTRLYAPDDFGVLGVYASILGIASVIASLRYEQAIPLPRSDRLAINVLVVSLIIVAAMSLFVAITVVFLGTEIAAWTNISSANQILYLIPVGVFLVGTFQALNYWAVRRQAFGRIARTTLLQSGGSVTTQLAFGSFGVGPVGLIVGQIVGQAAGIGSLARLIRNDPIRLVRVVSARSLKRVALRYRRFPMIFTWSALLNSLGLMGPTILLAIFYGTAVVGWYALVQRVLGVPTSLLGRSVTNVFFSESARLARDAPVELMQLFLNVLKKLTILGCVTIVPLGLVSPWLFPIIFGSEWVNAGRYALILSPMILMQFLSSPFGVILAVLERQGLAIVREIIRAVLVASALLLAHAQGYTADKALVLLSIAGALSYVSHLLISWLAIRHRVKATGVV